MQLRKKARVLIEAEVKYIGADGLLTLTVPGNGHGERHITVVPNLIKGVTYQPFEEGDRVDWNCRAGRFVGALRDKQIGIVRLDPEGSLVEVPLDKLRHMDPEVPGGPLAGFVSDSDDGL